MYVCKKNPKKKKKKRKRKRRKNKEKRKTMMILRFCYFDGTLLRKKNYI